MVDETPIVTIEDGGSLPRPSRLGMVVRFLVAVAVVTALAYVVLELLVSAAGWS